MMRTWFTSDTHFGHALMARLRKFNCIQDHDEALITEWNKRVKKGDVVWHLGDFAWRSAGAYRFRLNGEIHLVKGNHDRLSAREEKAIFSSVKNLRECKVGDQVIVLCHYAMRTWRKSHHGAWHLYGHSHGSLADDPNSMSMDVGVDTNKLAPYSFEEIAARMATKSFKPIDHHIPDADPKNIAGEEDAPEERLAQPDKEE